MLVACMEVYSAWQIWKYRRHLGMPCMSGDAGES